MRPRQSPLPLLSPLGALLLLGSLFLPWSHQLTSAVRAQFRGAVLFGVARDPTAFQVYAISAELLALLAGLIVAAGLWGRRRLRVIALAFTLVSVAFVLHARGRPPTNGLLLAAGPARYLEVHARAGTGETLALTGLALAVLGLGAGVLWGESVPSPAAPARPGTAPARPQVGRGRS